MGFHPERTRVGHHMPDTRIDSLYQHVVRDFSVTNLRPSLGNHSTRTILQISHGLIGEAANQVFRAYGLVAGQNAAAVPAPIRIEEIQGDSAGD
jgi:hypothetical protein